MELKEFLDLKDEDKQFQYISSLEDAEQKKFMLQIKKKNLRLFMALQAKVNSSRNSEKQRHASVEFEDGDTIEEILIELIEEPLFNDRLYVDPKKVKKIADSIRSDGLLSPIIVEKKRL